jgi:deoxyribonuclease-4
MDSFRLFAHTGYLINLAGEGDNRDKSVLAMIDEMQRAERLGITGLVLHPGSHRGIGEAEAVVRIAGAIDEAIGRAENVNVRILLETSSGQGSSVGSRFEHLRDIIGASAHPGRLAVCLDTCHIFARI